MDLCVHFGKPAFIVFISSLYLYFGFSNKHFSIQFQNSIQFQHKHVTLSSDILLLQTEKVRHFFKDDENELKLFLPSM